jgi:DHA2 family multidrug resistance protein
MALTLDDTLSTGRSRRTIAKLFRLALRSGRQRPLKRPAFAAGVPKAAPLPRSMGARAVASLAAFSAAWMVLMATRYFSLSAGAIDTGIGIGSAAGSWLSTAYLACEPVGVAVGCWLALGFSLRRVLLASIIVFIGACGLLALVPVFPVSLAARALMGLAAGAIIPLSILTQLRAFNLAWRPLAIGLYASASTMAPQIASSVDAWAVGHDGWTAVFWATLVPGSIALLAGFRSLPHEPIRWRPLLQADIAGLVTLSAGLAFAAIGVSQGSRLHWLASPLILSMFALGGVCLALFVLHERKDIRHPVLSLGLTRRRNLLLGLVGTLPLQISAGISGVLVPAYLIAARHFGPEQIAPVLNQAFWPQCITYPLCILALRWRVLDARIALCIGLACIALACAFDLPAMHQWTAENFRLGQIIQGIGLPFILLPLLVLFVGDVTPKEGVYAASIFNISRSLAGTISIAGITTMTQHQPGPRGTADALFADALVIACCLLFAGCGLALAMAEFGSGHPDFRARIKPRLHHAR